MLLTDAYSAVMALVVTTDRAVLVYLVPTVLLFSLAIVAATAKGRKPLEWVTLFAFWSTVIGLLVLLFFHVVLHRPIVRVELIGYP